MGDCWPDGGLHTAKRARYTNRIEDIRRTEYPMLSGITYLDHAASTPAPASLLTAFSHELTTTLFGNPHSKSSSSQLSSQRIDDTRLKVLRFFQADPEDFDVVFVANATAGVKLVADAFRDAAEEEGHDGFQYAYHQEVHTSIVGVRELTQAGSNCLAGEEEVEEWLRNEETVDRNDGSDQNRLHLFAYPGQSNMNGYRPDPNRYWCKRIQKLRRRQLRRIYTLYDAAGLVSTTPLDLSDLSSAPDFTVVSFYKIFGFPDLGALIVRKASGNILEKRKYFGGGTVEMVITGDDPWHSKKNSSYHEKLEDGTLPFHSIIGLHLAMTIHQEMYGSMHEVSKHTGQLAKAASERLNTLAHANGRSVCEIFKPEGAEYGTDGFLGPVIAFNLRHSNGDWVPKSEVEKLATIRNIQLRTGTLCTPGAVSSYLGLTEKVMRRNFSLGQRCGDENDLMDGIPTGVLRISFGAMSSMADVDTFVNFVSEFYVDEKLNVPVAKPTTLSSPSRFYIESLSVFPIKSCAAFNIPADQPWEVHPEGLAWDREWCLIHQGTGTALSQKKYPRMALLKPHIELKSSCLTISHSIEGTSSTSIDIPLERHHRFVQLSTSNVCTKISSSTVCGDTVEVQVYTSPEIATFFTSALGVPCTLARFPPRSHSTSPSRSMKPLRQSPPTSRSLSPSRPPREAQSSSDPSPPTQPNQRSLLLSNESPILIISRSSVNRLNESIKSLNGPGKAVPADAFRGNLILAEDRSHDPGVSEQPYVEDQWTKLTISSRTYTANNNHRSGDSGRESTETGRGGGLVMEVLGPCHRCQMICIDQKRGERHTAEPFATLAKTRRWGGGVWFGMHLGLGGAPGIEEADRGHGKGRFVMVGDAVFPE